MSKEKIKVLVVAYGEAMRRLLHRYVEKIGYIVVACNSDEATDRISNEEVDIILWDFNVKQLDDIKHEIDTINKIKWKYEIPLIVVTDLYETAIFIKSLNIPTSDCLAKPFKLDDLVSKIATKLHRRA